MTSAGDELKALLDALGRLSAEAGAGSLAELAAREGGLAVGSAPALSLERPATSALMIAGALEAALQARRTAATLPEPDVTSKLAGMNEAGQNGEVIERQVQEELERLKRKLEADVTTLLGDLERELPLVVRGASTDDLKRHFPAFVEQSFERWAQAELAELEAELTQVSERTDALLRRPEGGLARPSILPELGTRALEVDSFPRDFGVFALSTFGIAVLFSNALLGGALLVLAPVVARYGRERHEADLRERAAAEALRAVREASTRLSAELERRLDGFGEQLRRFTAGSAAPARRGLREILEQSLRDRAGGGDEQARCEGWQQRLSELLARLRALKLGTEGDRSAI